MLDSEKNIDKTVEMMSEIRKLKPYIQSLSKNILFTASIFCWIIASAVSLLIIILGIWDVCVFKLSADFSSVVLSLLIIVCFFMLISFFTFIIYIIFECYDRLRKAKGIGYFSEEAFLYDLKNIKDLDKKYKEDILQFALTWMNSVIKRYEERIKVFGTTFSISSLMVVISFFNKPIIKTELESWGVISFITNYHNILLYALVMLTVFIIGVGLGTFALRIKMLEYKYKIAIVETTILRKTSKEKQTYFYQKS